MKSQRIPQRGPLSRTGWLLLWTGLLVLTAAPTIDAASYYVATDGGDEKPGTEAQPFRTIQKALDMTQAGDTVRVNPGVYHGRIFFKSSGSPGKPITLQGATGAIIDGGDRFSGWEPLPEYGEGVYKNSLPLLYAPGNLTWKNRHVVWMGDPEGRNRHNAPGWALLRKEASDAAWDGVEALAGTRGTNAYIRFRHGQDPDDEDITIAPQGEGAVNIVGQHHCVVRGFTIRNAWSALRLAASASDNLVEDNRLLGGFYTVMIDRGAARNRIRRNTITLDYVYEDVGHPQGRSLADYQSYNPLRLYNEFQIHAAIYVAGQADNEISENEIQRHFAGVFAYSRPNDSEGNRNLKVFGNKIHHISGYCLLLKGAGAESEWHDNLLYESHATMRVEQNPFGPIYIYRNRFYHEMQVAQPTPRGYLAIGDLMFSFFKETPDTTVYFYHNSFSGASYALSLGVKMPNVWFINNIFSARQFLVAYGEPGLGGAHFDYNWVGGEGARKLNGMGGHNVFAPGERLWNVANPDFALTQKSPARRIGLDLSKPFTVDGVTSPSLPGMQPGYFTGNQPDAGAVQFGPRGQ